MSRSKKLLLAAAAFASLSVVHRCSAVGASSKPYGSFGPKAATARMAGMGGKQTFARSIIPDISRVSCSRPKPHITQAQWPFCEVSSG